jgi:hypothetical protein
LSGPFPDICFGRIGLAQLRLVAKQRVGHRSGVPHLASCWDTLALRLDFSCGAIVALAVQTSALILSTDQSAAQAGHARLACRGGGKASPQVAAVPNGVSPEGRTAPLQHPGRRSSRRPLRGLLRGRDKVTRPSGTPAKILSITPRKNIPISRNSDSAYRLSVPRRPGTLDRTTAKWKPFFPKGSCSIKIWDHDAILSHLVTIQTSNACILPCRAPR